MVGVDLTKMDANLIAYASFLSHLLKPEEVHYIHAQRNLELPEGVAAKHKIHDAPVDDLIIDDLKKETHQHFDYIDDAHIIYEVVEGPPFQALLHWQEIKNIDLLLVGRKHRQHGSGVIAEKLSRKANCLVWFVPEGSAPRIQKILVPVDMSRHAELSFKIALELAGALDGAEVICQHVYEIPLRAVGRRPPILMRKSLVAEVESSIKASYQRWIDELNTGGMAVKPVFTLNEENPAKHIYELAQKEKVDLIVAGYKGKSGAEVMFLGSVTEKLIKYNEQFPLLLIKKQDENQHLLSQLKSS